MVICVEYVAYLWCFQITMEVTRVKDLVHAEHIPDVKKLTTTLAKFTDIGVYQHHTFTLPFLSHYYHHPNHAYPYHYHGHPYRYSLCVFCFPCRCNIHYGVWGKLYVCSWRYIPEAGTSTGVSGVRIGRHTDECIQTHDGPGRHPLQARTRTLGAYIQVCASLKHH